MCAIYMQSTQFAKSKQLQYTPLCTCGACMYVRMYHCMVHPTIIAAPFWYNTIKYCPIIISCEPASLYLRIRCKTQINYIPIRLIVITLLDDKDTEVFFVLESEIQFHKERMIDFQQYFSFSFHIRNLLLLHNMVFAKYLHYGSKQN